MAVIVSRVFRLFLHIACYFAELAILVLGVYSGNYNNGSFNNGGSNGNYWSSTVNNSNNAYNLNFNSSNANVNNNNKNNGFAIRCVAKS